MWFDHKSGYKKLKVVYNNSLRRLTIHVPCSNSSNEMFANLCIQSFIEFLKTDVFGYDQELLFQRTCLYKAFFQFYLLLYFKHSAININTH